VPTIYHGARFWWWACFRLRSLSYGEKSRFAHLTHCGLICLARKRNFVWEAATRWHDGQITKNLSSPSRKNILLSFSSKSFA
jgi:hypothetical protein